MEEECDEPRTPPEIKSIASSTTENLIPITSKRQYEKAYHDFVDWCNSHNVPSGYFTENVILGYLGELSNKYAPSTLWSIFSMIKSTLLAYHGKDVRSFEKVQAFLKQKSSKHKAKKSEVFTRDQFERFFREADDKEYLHLKLVAFFGLFGACRKGELSRMKVEDITDHGSHLFIVIPVTKTGVSRSFDIVGHQNPALNALLHYRKYLSLRPDFPADNPNKDRFFIQYKEGKCCRTPIGINTFGAIPSKIAAFLNLDNPERYTGHALRRSSVTWLADAGIDKTSLKRFVKWKSDTVLEGYIAESKQNKRKIAELLMNGDEEKRLKVEKENEQPNIFISNCNNCTFEVVFNNGK